MNKKQVVNTVYKVDCKILVDDNIIVTSELVDFLYNTFKVNGKTSNFEKVVANGQPSTLVKITSDKRVVYIDTIIPIKKRYIKYLLKIYFAKNKLRDYIRVLANSPTGYTLKYIQTADVTQGST